MSSISNKINDIRGLLKNGPELVAVSKFHSPEEILEAYNAGQKIFGESRVQELLAKEPQLPSDIFWHFIGHLQTNKVRQLIGHVAMIESVDSLKLLKLVSSESYKKGVKTDVLLQVHVAMEETKFGFTPEELMDFMATYSPEDYENVVLRGVMGMASNTDNLERVRSDFKQIRGIFDKIKSCYGESMPNFDTVSMGMSHDWQIAAEEGSTLVRIGTAIFGPRSYAI